MYAIIATGGKQYKVSEGDEIFVEKLDAEEGSAVTFDQVLAVSDNVKAKKSSFTSTKEKQVITRRTVIDKHTLRLRLKRSTLN